MTAGDVRGRAPRDAAGASSDAGGRPRDLAELTREIAELLAPVEERLEAEAPAAPRLPQVLIVGPPRSGTTLLLQWLAATGAFGVPTNLLARFWRTPALGARVQHLLSDPRYAFGDELADLAAPADFRSALGKTRGALAPSEFWLFWRRFLPPGAELRKLSAEELARVNGAGLARALAALEAVLERPLALKALILQYDLDALARILPDAVFLDVARDPVRNAQSLLEARERYHGDRATWWSVRPPGHEALLGDDPVRQVAGQVALTRRSLESQLAELGPERCVSVRYEDFCAAPGALYAALAERLAARGVSLPAYAGPASFPVSDALRLSPAEADLARAAYEELYRSGVPA